jgi:hypothetical protein
VVAEFALDRKKGITMMMHVGFAGKKSWLVQTMVDGADKAGPAPDIFWHAPKASESITWARSGDPKRFEPVLKTARALAEGLMAKEKIGSDADRKAIVALLRPAGNPYVATVTTTGHFAPTTAGSGAIGDVLDAAVGWYLIGIDQGPNDLRAWLNEAVKVYNRPSLQKMMKDELGSDAKHLPKVKVVPAPRNLGAGALAIEVIIPDVDDPMAGLIGEPIDPDAPVAAKPKPVDIKFYLLMMSDSGRTWLGLAANRDGLAKVMDSVKGATPGADTIKGKPGLDVFRTKKHSVGGVTTLEGIIGSIKPMAMTFMTIGGAPQGPARMILNVLERMPNKGESPIVVMGYVDGGVKPSVEATFNVPEGTLVDLGYVVTNIISIVGANP